MGVAEFVQLMLRDDTFLFVENELRDVTQKLVDAAKSQEENVAIPMCSGDSDQGHGDCFLKGSEFESVSTPIDDVGASSADSLGLVVNSVGETRMSDQTSHQFLRFENNVPASVCSASSRTGEGCSCLLAQETVDFVEKELARVTDELDQHYFADNEAEGKRPNGSIDCSSTAREDDGREVRLEHSWMEVDGFCTIDMDPDERNGGHLKEDTPVDDTRDSTESNPCEITIVCDVTGVNSDSNFPTQKFDECFHLTSKLRCEYYDESENSNRTAANASSFEYTNLAMKRTCVRIAAEEEKKLVPASMTTEVEIMDTSIKVIDGGELSCADAPLDLTVWNRNTIYKNLSRENISEADNDVPCGDFVSCKTGNGRMENSLNATSIRNRKNDSCAKEDFNFVFYSATDECTAFGNLIATNVNVHDYAIDTLPMVDKYRNVGTHSSGNSKHDKFAKTYPMRAPELVTLEGKNYTDTVDRTPLSRNVFDIATLPEKEKKKTSLAKLYPDQVTTPGNKCDATALDGKSNPVQPISARTSHSKKMMATSKDTSGEVVITTEHVCNKSLSIKTCEKTVKYKNNYKKVSKEVECYGKEVCDVTEIVKDYSKKSSVALKYGIRKDFSKHSLSSSDNLVLQGQNNFGHTYLVEKNNSCNIVFESAGRSSKRTKTSSILKFQKDMCPVESSSGKERGTHMIKSVPRKEKSVQNRNILPPLKKIRALPTSCEDLGKDSSIVDPGSSKSCNGRVEHVFQSSTKKLTDCEQGTGLTVDSLVCETTLIDGRNSKTQACIRTKMVANKFSSLLKTGRQNESSKVIADKLNKELKVTERDEKERLRDFDHSVSKPFKTNDVNCILSSSQSQQNHDKKNVDIRKKRAKPNKKLLPASVTPKVSSDEPAKDMVPNISKDLGPKDNGKSGSSATRLAKISPRHYSDATTPKSRIIGECKETSENGLPVSSSLCQSKNERPATGVLYSLNVTNDKQVESSSSMFETLENNYKALDIVTDPINVESTKRRESSKHTDTVFPGEVSFITKVPGDAVRPVKAVHSKKKHRRCFTNSSRTKEVCIPCTKVNQTSRSPGALAGKRLGKAVEAGNVGTSSGNTVSGVLLSDYQTARQISAQELVQTPKMNDEFFNSFVNLLNQSQEGQTQQVHEAGQFTDGGTSFSPSTDKSYCLHLPEFPEKHSFVRSPSSSSGPSTINVLPSAYHLTSSDPQDSFAKCAVSVTVSLANFQPSSFGQCFPTFDHGIEDESRNKFIKNSLLRSDGLLNMCSTENAGTYERELLTSVSKEKQDVSDISSFAYEPGFSGFYPRSSCPTSNNQIRSYLDSEIYPPLPLESPPPLPPLPTSPPPITPPVTPSARSPGFTHLTGRLDKTQSHSRRTDCFSFSTPYTSTPSDGKSRFTQRIYRKSYSQDNFFSVVQNPSIEIATISDGVLHNTVSVSTCKFNLDRSPSVLRHSFSVRQNSPLDYPHHSSLTDSSSPNEDLSPLHRQQNVSESFSPRLSENRTHLASPCCSKKRNNLFQEFYSSDCSDDTLPRSNKFYSPYRRWNTKRTSKSFVWTDSRRKSSVSSPSNVQEARLADPARTQIQAGVLSALTRPAANVSTIPLAFTTCRELCSLDASHRSNPIQETSSRRSIFKDLSYPKQWNKFTTSASGGITEASVFGAAMTNDKLPFWPEKSLDQKVTGVSEIPPSSPRMVDSPSETGPRKHFAIQERTNFMVQTQPNPKFASNVSFKKKSLSNYSEECLQNCKSHADQLPFRCSFCGRHFKHKRSRDRHLKLHTGDKKYKCGLCDAAFSRSDHLKIHQKTHGGHRAHRCAVCDRGYGTATALTAHMQAHKVSPSGAQSHQLSPETEGNTPPPHSSSHSHSLAHPSRSFATLLRDSPPSPPLDGGQGDPKQHSLALELKKEFVCSTLDDGSRSCDEREGTSPPAASPLLRCPLCSLPIRSHSHLQRHLNRQHPEVSSALADRPASTSGSSAGCVPSLTSTPSPRPPTLHSPRPLPSPRLSFSPRSGGQDASAEAVLRSNSVMNALSSCVGSALGGLGGAGLPSHPLLALMGAKLSCCYCAQDGFGSLESLQLHLHTMHGPSLDVDLSGGAPSVGLGRGVSCELCGARLPDVPGLQRHVLAAHSFTDLLARTAEGVFCAQCLLPFSNPGALAEHIKLVHAGGLAAAAGFAAVVGAGGLSVGIKLGKRSQSPADLPTDLSKKNRTDVGSVMDLSSTTLLCNQCNAPFNNFESFRNHLKTHLDGGQGSVGLVCSECKLVLPSRGDLESHLASHLLSVSTEYGCQACFKLFSKPDDLQKHLIDIHAHHLYRCALCKEMFDSKVSIQVHFAVKHSNECKVHKCTRCSMAFHSRSESEQHIRTVHIDNDRSQGNAGYRCLLCHLTVATEAEFTTHLSTHQKQFQCNLCDEAFHVEFLLDKHVQSQHTSEINGNHSRSVKGGSRSPNKEDLRCELCNIDFSTESALVNHYQKIHGSKAGSAKVAAATVSLFCAYCNEACKSRADLEAHVKLHQGSGGRHKCNICDELCPSAAMLAQHKLSHIKALSGATCCSVCHESLGSAERVSSHQNEHRPGPLPQSCVVCRQTLLSSIELRVHAKFHGSQSINYGDIIPNSEDSKEIFNNNIEKMDLKSSLKCPLCQIKLETLDEAENHSCSFNKKDHCSKLSSKTSSDVTTNKIERIEPRTYQCIKCQESFPTEAEIEAHVSVHLQTEGSRHECHQCRANYDTPLRLQCHLIEHTFEGCGSYTCYLCSAVFTAAHRLQQHMHEHGLNARPYDCHHCHQRFFFRAELDNHVWSHPEATSGKCEECFSGRAKTSPKQGSSSRNNHTTTTSTKQTINNASNKKNTSLPHISLSKEVVGRNSGSSTQDRMHGKSASKNGVSKTELGASDCDEKPPGGTEKGRHRNDDATKTGSNSEPSSVSSHGRGSVSCSTCGRRCCDAASRALHELTHEGGRPYLCSRCGASFTRKCEAAKHVKTKHAEEDSATEKYLASGSPVSEESRVCDPVKSNVSAGQDAVSVKSENRASQCGCCSATFATDEELLSHVAEAHSSSQTVFVRSDSRCSSCSEDEEKNPSSPTSQSN